MKGYQFLLLLILSFCFANCSFKSRNICEDESKTDILKSVEYYKKKVAKNPADQKSYNYLGMSYYKLSDLKNAEMVFTQLLALNESYEMAYLNRGVCRLFQDDKTGACLDFKRSIELGQNPLVFDEKRVSSYYEANCLDKSN